MVLMTREKTYMLVKRVQRKISFHKDRFSLNLSRFYLLHIFKQGVYFCKTRFMLDMKLKINQMKLPQLKIQHHNWCTYFHSF